MKLVFAICLLFSGITVFAQNVETHMVEPAGVYKEINMANDTRVCQLLADSTYVGRSKLADSVMRNANSYTPPVLYFLSNTLFSMKKYEDAEYWFYIAQLRARYDVNRCADKTANAANYNQTFGPQINTYAIKVENIDTLTQIIKRAVEFVKGNDEHYDQRWINLSGLAAISAGIDGKTKGEQLSKNPKDWPAIKAATIKDYYDGFLEFLKSRKK